jgi:hypothetical protein
MMMPSRWGEFLLAVLCDVIALLSVGIQKVNWVLMKYLNIE